MKLNSRSLFTGDDRSSRCAATNHSRPEERADFRRARSKSAQLVALTTPGEYASSKRGGRDVKRIDPVPARSTRIYRAAHKSFRHSFGVIGACYDNGIQREFVMIRRRFYRSLPLRLPPFTVFSSNCTRCILSFPISHFSPSLSHSHALPLDNNLLRQTRTIQFHSRKITCLRDREINNELVSKMNIPASETPPRGRTR